MIKAIVAVDLNWAIGSEGSLLTHLPKDLKRFKEITKGQFVIMGRKTLDSLPGGKALKDRTTIILTQNREYVNSDVLVVHSIESLLNLVHGLSTNNSEEKDFFVCGGGQVYKQLLPYTQEILVTKINFKAFDSDTFFPNLDKIEGWKVTNEEINIEDSDYITDYIIYERG